MKKKKLSKQQLREKQKLDNKKFNRIVLISFSILFPSLMSILVFYTYRCDTRFTWHKWVWYGKQIPGEWACMNGDNLQLHKTLRVDYKNKAYRFCSQECCNHLVEHFTEVAMVPDAFTGDSINKADAIIGHKEKGKSEIVYFKNTETFHQYYESKK